MTEPESENPDVVGEVPALSPEELDQPKRTKKEKTDETGTSSPGIEDVSILTQQLLAQNLQTGPGVEIHHGKPEAGTDTTSEDLPPVSVWPDPKMTNRPPNCDDLTDITRTLIGMRKAGIPKEAQPSTSETSTEDEPAPVKIVTCPEGDEE